ncbi:hypothetical protein [uncultured Polaribacter sp.]|uniref:hypothetical protein n=1 Tax=uncultured Polaribacter sp. TaxID=174711 RepID=UPI00262A8AE8|nr:hypothetical protein [uncultured Polaribacter sp.]
MKNFNIKVGVLGIVLSLGTFYSCQQEDELLNEELSSGKEVALEDEYAAKGTCDPNEFKLIDAISGTDYNDAVSTQIDDRSCSFDYRQSSYGSSFNWGGYRLRASNNQPGKLQVRMERSTRQTNYANGKYIDLSGTVRILNAGLVNGPYAPNDLRDKNGTYIAQVKGKHTNLRTDLNESRDPAIVLFIAKPKRFNNGTGSVIRDSNGKIKEFVIYAELVRKRGGSSNSGRRLIKITTVKRNRDFNVNIRTEFYNSGSTKRQRVRVNINGVAKTFEISVQNTAGQSAEPTEMRIRMGAYRCVGGGAEILWKDDLSVSRN